MGLFTNDTVESARKRLQELESLHARAVAYRDGARTSLGIAVAADGAEAVFVPDGGDGTPLRHHIERGHLDDAERRLLLTETALPAARQALREAEEREAAKRSEQLKKAAAACNRNTVRAADRFDASLASLAEAFDALEDARATEQDARRAAGLATLRRAAGWDEMCALFHASPRLGMVLRKRILAAPLPPTNKNFRSMLDFVRNPSVDVDAETNAEAPTAQEQLAHVQQ